MSVANAPIPDPGEAPLITRPFARLLAMQAAFGFAFSIFLLLPKVMASTFASTPGEIGLVMAAFGAASLLFIPVAARAIDGMGNRGALVLANGLMAAGAFGFMFVGRAGVAAVLLRGLHGVAWSLSFAAGMSMAADLAPSARLAQALGVFGGASLAMNALAPAIAEPIGEWLGHRAIFALAAVAAVAGAVLARRLPGGHEREHAPHPAPVIGPHGDRPSEGSSSRGRAFVVLGMGGLAFGVMFTFIAPHALAHGVRAVRGFFAAYTVAALGVRLFAARMSDRLGHRRVAFVAVAAYGLTVIAAGVAGPTHLVALGASFGAAHGAVFPALMALLLAGTAGRARGRTLAIANAAMNLGVAAVFVLGVVAGRIGYAAVFVVAGCLTVATAGLMARPPARAREPSS